MTPVTPTATVVARDAEQVGADQVGIAGDHTSAGSNDVDGVALLDLILHDDFLVILGDHRAAPDWMN